MQEYNFKIYLKESSTGVNMILLETVTLKELSEDPLWNLILWCTCITALQENHVYSKVVIYHKFDVHEVLQLYQFDGNQQLDLIMINLLLGVGDQIFLFVWM